MKRNILIAPIFFIVLCLFAQSASSQTDKPFSIDESPLPKPTTPVLDNANVLDAATKNRIEDKIIKFQKESNNNAELAVAIVKTTGYRSIEDYSIAVARGWGIGSRQQDNPGALLFIAIDDRKYYTQVSRDLEDELPDGLVGSLQRQYLVPQFKRGNYSKGIEDTIDAYIKTIKQRQSGVILPEESENKEFRGYDNFGEYLSSNCCGILICLTIILIIVLFAISSGGSGGGGGRKKRRKYKSTGDDIVGDIAWGVLTGIIAGGSGGGSSSSDWGGSSSGGGWGGFGGGGDFGGGGAGGGW